MSERQAQFEWMMGSIPNDRSRKHTDRNGFGFAGHYAWTRWGGGSGREDPAAVCEHPGLYKSESRAGVGELGERGPQWLLQYPAPHLPTLFTPTYSTDRQGGSQTSHSLRTHSAVMNSLTQTLSPYIILKAPIICASCHSLLRIDISSFQSLRVSHQKRQ